MLFSAAISSFALDLLSQWSPGAVCSCLRHLHPFYCISLKKYMRGEYDRGISVVVGLQNSTISALCFGIVRHSCRNIQATYWCSGGEGGPIRPPPPLIPPLYDLKLWIKKHLVRNHKNRQNFFLAMFLHQKRVKPPKTSFNRIASLYLYKYLKSQNL